MSPVPGIDILRPAEHNAVVELHELRHDLAAVFICGKDAKAAVVERIARRQAEREGRASAERPRKRASQRGAHPRPRGGAA